MRGAGPAQLAAQVAHGHVDLERLTGIRERRVSDGKEDSLSLAVAAARDCLDRSRNAWSAGMAM